MTTPSGEFPWEAANATDGLAWYAGQGIGDWKARMAENVMKSFLSIGLFALRVPFTEDIADAVIGPDAVLDGEIPSLAQVSGFLGGKWDQLDDISGAVQPIIDVFTALLEATGGDFSDLPNVILKLIGDLGSMLTDWLIDPSRLPLIPLGSIFIPGLGDEPNLLTGFGDFGSADTVDDPSDVWSFDASVGRTAAGAVTTTADSTRHVLVGDLIPSRENQKFNVSAWSRWTGLVVPVSVDAIEVNVRAYSGSTQVSETTLATIASPAGTSSWVELAGNFTVPAGVDGVRVCLSVEADCTAGQVWFDDVTGKRPGLLPQLGVDGLPGALANLGDWITTLVQQGLGALGIPAVGTLFDQIADFADGLDDWMTDTDSTAAGLDDLLGGLLSAPGSLLGTIPQANLSIVSDVIKGFTGFLSGQGAPASSNVLADMLGALGSFTGSTNSTAITADEAQGVGGNALTNTVSIQAQVSGLADRADAGLSARPLHQAMDFTADPTFPLGEIQSYSGAHTHTVTTTASNTSNGLGTVVFSGNTGNTTAGGDSHSHSVSLSNNLQHTHPITALSGSTNSQGVDISATPVTLTATQAYFGYIRCGSTQEKRLFNFLAQSVGTVSTFNLDVYRMASDGTLTLEYSSANFAGALTGSLAWVQHTIPSGTASVNVIATDVIAIQLRMTGAGSVLLGGKTTPVPINPPGWLPRRISAVRNPSGTPAPSSIAAATANASHTSAAIPYIEAAIDTGLANAPLSLADNFNGSLSSQWLMTGVNTLDATSNAFGIVSGGSDGWSWGKFQQQLRTDQAKVGFTTTSPSGEEQAVWFKGNGPNSHVGLAITSTTAVIYTMSGGTRTNRASAASGTSSGAAWTLEYNAGTKVFTAKRGVTTVATWTDSGNLAPTGLGNRCGGIGLHATRSGWFGLTYTEASPIDDWLLADI